MVCEDGCIVVIMLVMFVGLKFEGFVKEFFDWMFDVGIVEQYVVIMVVVMVMQGMKLFLVIYLIFL